MFILAKGGETYARMRFNVGPGGQAMLPVQVDCSTDFPASNHHAWEEEYLQHVTIEDDWVFTQHPLQPFFDPYVSYQLTVTLLVIYLPAKCRLVKDALLDDKINPAMVAGWLFLFMTTPFVGGRALNDRNSP